MKLPRGRHFAVTWGIPDLPGGMTTALVHRSRLFAAAGHPVTILTFELREQPVRSFHGVPVLNLWEWLRENPISTGPLRHAATPTGIRRDAQGRLLQVDHRRADGSLAVIDRRDSREAGVIGGRTIVLCDERGAPVRSFDRVWALYRWWLDQLTDGQTSWIIVDSKTAANSLATYRRSHATVVHLVHNTHLAADGSLRASRRRVFENLDAFDVVVLLTQSQRRDLGRRHNLAVVPNSIPLPPHSAVQRAGVVVLASLTARKRVDHAVRAARIAGVTLEVFGDGERRAALEALGGDVVYRGHMPTARERLATASAILLTGEAEGLPLVLLESMAAGCIPIAYDVRYGPADVIRDRVNGYLVASGDVAGLAAALSEFHSLDPRVQQRMRAAARRAAARYSDAAALRRWAQVLRRAARRAWRQRVVRVSLRTLLSRWRRRALSGG